MADHAAQTGMDLVTLPHHVEFLSDRWREAATEFWRTLPPAPEGQAQRTALLRKRAVHRCAASSEPAGPRGMLDASFRRGETNDLARLRCGR